MSYEGCKQCHHRLQETTCSEIRSMQFSTQGINYFLGPSLARAYHILQVSLPHVLRPSPYKVHVPERRFRSTPDEQIIIPSGTIGHGLPQKYCSSAHSISITLTGCGMDSTAYWNTRTASIPDCACQSLTASNILLRFGLVGKTLMYLSPISVFNMSYARHG